MQSLPGGDIICVLRADLSSLVELLREAQRLANSLAGRPEMDAKKLLNVLTNAYIDEMDKRWEAFEKMQL